MTLMDTERVAWLKDRVAEAASSFDETVNEPATYTPVDRSAFGNTPRAPECRDAWDQLVGKVLAATNNLHLALRTDVDRLGQVIDSFARLDDEEADRLNAAGSRMTVISSHAHNDSRNFPGPINDALRARQLDRLVDYAADVAGPVVVGSDDNVSLVEDEQSSNPFDPGYDRLGPEALERYQDEGFEEVGDVGGTIGGESIDHIHARGVEPGEATLVDGGPSDHDGQAVTHTVPPW
jgi:hypothetical protein